ncbi:MAG: UDP-N-acetylmuramate--L-alanine ligase [Caldisericales bacterium]|nr:UDP-N-acetylmuramate--L-alanine ligase [Caldisericales bacterium]
MRVPRKGSRIHLIGIGGAGMRGIALMLMQMGYVVTGSDIDCDRELVRGLGEKGAILFSGQKAENITDQKVVIYSSAIKESNPELERARELGIKCIHRADFFIDFGLSRKILGVAGTHGKTTTTAMIAHVLERMEQEVSYYFGSPAIGGEQARWSGNQMIVMETDESDKSFLKFNCDLAVVTNIDWDHMDAYGHSKKNLLDAFESFVSQAKKKVLNADDENTFRMKLKDMDQVITFGRNSLSHVKADLTSIFREDHNLCSTTAVRVWGKPIGRLKLRVPGDHNVSNALAALSAIVLLGFDPKLALPHFFTFPGTQRRLELMGVANSNPVYDDYAHHPTAIIAGLKALRSYYPDEKICLVMQPFRFARISYLLDEYSTCVSLADRIIVTQVFPQEENNLERSREFCYRLRAMNPNAQIAMAGTLELVPKIVKSSLIKNEVVYLAGPYPIRSCAKPILEAIK